MIAAVFFQEMLQPSIGTTYKRLPDSILYSKSDVRMIHVVKKHVLD